MKTLKLFALLLFFALLGFNNRLAAQVDVTINPVILLAADVGLGADFVVSENISIEAKLGYGSTKLSSPFSNLFGEEDDSFDPTLKAFSINAVGKYYFNPKRGADGFYADLFLRNVNRTYDSTPQSGNADVRWNRTSIGFGAGYKVVAAKGLVFDIGLGLGRSIIGDPTYVGEGNQQSVNWPNTMLQGKLGIGYRFGGGK
jgi:Protein of unknown function (DUF3575)